MSETASRTRTAPKRAPGGWWMEHPRYRRYVLFAATGLTLWISALVLLRGIVALGKGVAAWEAYLDALGSGIGVVGMTLLLISTLFFSIRWLRVGVKIPTVQIGPLPGPPEPVIFVAHFVGLAVLTALLVLVLSGVIL